MANWMKILRIDHIVLTVKDIPITVAFYERVLGLQHVIFDGHYHALHFGSQKINLHPAANEYPPHADKPLPGSGDLCFIASGRIEDVIKNLQLQGVDIEHGPVPQIGAAGKMMSVYFRDPDRNLIEVACYSNSF
jgi:catechol 2,3-dioxygenase-like lactoylglutathione lyase family enzyme